MGAEVNRCHSLLKAWVVRGLKVKGVLDVLVRAVRGVSVAL